jgi:cytochrome c-type biogenesis protein
MLDTVQTWLYQLAEFSTNLVQTQLQHLTPVSISIIALTGLLTSLTPCMLSMLPITIGYIGGYETKTRLQAAIQSTWFALGLATTLALMGIVAGIVGKVYGQVGFGLPIIVSIIAILLGLNLLELLPLQLPSYTGLGWMSKEMPTGVKSYLVGLTFGLVASPCSTPVLGALLAWVAQSKDPLLGSVLLLAYTVGYVAPLVLAGTFTASVKRLLEVRRWSGWITPASGVLLIGFGVFSLLTRLLPGRSF